MEAEPEDQEEDQEEEEAAAAMLWSVQEALERQTQQIGASACGATAVVDVLKALGVDVAPEEAERCVQTRLRRNESPLPDYLLSRSEAEVLSITDPQLCYILDGFLGLYGLIITGMFIKEKFFRTKVKGSDDGTYAPLSRPTGDTYEPLMTDPERGRNRRVPDDSTYTGLQKRSEPTYKELPVKRERQRKNEQVYQGLSSATRDTYDSLQMQPLPAR